MKNIRIILNGFGRIGRALLRRAKNDERFIIGAINDINPDIQNAAYMYNFDSIQGVSALSEALEARGPDTLRLPGQNQPIAYLQHGDCSDIDCTNADVLIDATGLSTNGDSIQKLLDTYPDLKVIATHCHPAVKHHLVLGGNHDHIDLTAQRFISSSICDATAIAPVLRALDEVFGVDIGHVTTVHPWLSYQNLLDGPSTSWANPGQIYHHYPLGRSALDNLIPKPTSAVDATLQSLENFSAKISSFSYRVPTSIVGSANIILQLSKAPRDAQSVLDTFEAFSAKYPWPIFAINTQPLISKDFVNRPESAIIDARWLELVDHQLHLVLWYDNENGYALRVLDQAGLLNGGY